jgi:hypothetical protein
VSERKLLASPWTKLRIGGACAALLILGAWLRPQTAAPLAPPEERPAPLLEEQVQQREPAPFRGIEDAVRRLPVRGIAVRAAVDPPITSDFRQAAAPNPPVFAVAVSNSYVLTHAAAIVDGRAPTIITGDGADLRTTIAAFDITSGMVLVSTSVAAGPAPVFAEAPARPGALVVAAARSSSADVAIPVFITTVTADRYGLGGIGANPPPGLPIYDLDGGLLAISAGDGVAWRIRHVLDRLLPSAAAGALPSSIGVAYQVIDERLAEAFGTSGLAIVDIAAGGPADAAGLEIGDAIVEVGDVKGAASELAAALSERPATVPLELSLRRDRRIVNVTVTPAFAHDVMTLPRATIDTGPAASTLFERDALMAAGIPVDAIVLTIGGRSVASGAPATRRQRSSDGPALVLLEHRGRRFFARVDVGR